MAHSWLITTTEAIFYLDNVSTTVKSTHSHYDQIVASIKKNKWGVVRKLVNNA